MNEHYDVHPSKAAPTKSSNKSKAYIALGATSIIWGTTWVASRYGVQHAPALQLSAMRQCIAGVLMISIFLLRGAPLPTWRQLGRLAFLSIFTFVLANGFSTWGVAFISSGLAALIGALYPLCVLLIEMIVFKKTNHPPLTYIGLLIGFAGVAVVFYENAFQTHASGYLFGIAISLTAMIAWSISTIFVAKDKETLNPYYAMGWQMLCGSAMIFLLAVITGNTISIFQIPFSSWLAIAYLVGLGSITAFIAFIYSVKHLPPAIASLYAYINPLVAMLAGALLLKESLSLHLLIGAVITLSGVYLVNRSAKH